MKVIKTSISDIDVFIQVNEDLIIEEESIQIDEESNSDHEPVEMEVDNFMGDDYRENISPERLNLNLPKLNVPNLMEAAKKIHDDAKKKAEEAVSKIGGKALDRTSKLIFSFADSLINQSKLCSNIPDELEVEYSITFGAEGKIIIVSGSTETMFKVRMKWNK